MTAASNGGAGNESLLTVLVAGAANLGIAAAKGVAGVLGGSAAMLSEAAHSVGDTVNEVLLVVALRRGGRAADRSHPFGYGQESFFWAFLAAMSTFVLGAGKLARDNVSLLTGEAAPVRFGHALLGELQGHPGVDQIVDLRTMMLGPDRVLVPAAVDFAPATSSSAIEATAAEIQQAVTRRFPEVRHVFLDPSPGTDTDTDGAL